MALVNQLRIEITTGGDDLRQNSQAIGYIKTDRFNIPYPQFWAENSVPLNNGKSWGNGSNNSRNLVLSPPADSSQFREFGIRFKSGQQFLSDTNDNWNIDQIKITAILEGDNEVPILEQSGSPLVRFTGDFLVWSVSLPPF